MTKKSGIEKNEQYISLLIWIMPIFTFGMRSISNSTYAWIGAAILSMLATFLVTVLTMMGCRPVPAYRSTEIILYIICLLGIFAEYTTTSCDGCNSYDKYCDCCVGECY